MQEVLDELDVIECFEVSAHKFQIGEMTKRQTDFYANLGVHLPVSLQ